MPLTDASLFRGVGRVEIGVGVIDVGFVAGWRLICGWIGNVEVGVLLLGVVGGLLMCLANLVMCV